MEYSHWYSALSELTDMAREDPSAIELNLVGSLHSMVSRLSAAGTSGAEPLTRLPVGDDSDHSSDSSSSACPDPGYGCQRIAYVRGQWPEQDEQEQDQAAMQADLEARLKVCVDASLDLKQRLGDATAMRAKMEERERAFEAQLAETQAEEKRLQEELDQLLNPEEPELPPPGPRCLEFVNGNIFMLVACAVIVANVVIMAMEALDEQNKVKFFWLDQGFMAFYVVELTLKAILLQRTLLLGDPKTVWWNWLDLIIVVTGVMDLWLVPLFEAMHVIGAGNQGSGIQLLRLLRLARLARVLRIVRVFFRADLSWTESERFQSFIMLIIALSSLMMGLEADFPGFVGWYYLEQVVLLIFTFELAAKLRNQGWRYFCNSDWAWNYLDFVIVVGGIVDQWMMPSITLAKKLMGIPAEHGGGLGKMMMMLRMARLLRILRLMRLIKSIPPLFTLLMGITHAMAGMMWVLLLTLVILYAFALLCVYLLRDGLVYGGEAPDSVATIFSTVPESVFVLFDVMNGDTGPLVAVFETLPISKLVFSLFVVLSSWAILSILTAVVSENMINATDEHRKVVEDEEQREKNKLRRANLDELFDMVDSNKNGQVTRHEFQDMVSDPIKREWFCDAANMQVNKLWELFDILELDGIMYREAFMTGLEHEGNEVHERSVMRLEKRMIEVEQVVTKLAGHLLPNE